MLKKNKHIVADWFFGGASRSPEQMVAAGVFSVNDYIYWDAERGVTVDGSNNITAVDDQGGTNKDLTGIASFYATLITDENGKKWMRFNESSLSAVLTNFATVASDYNFFIVFKYTGNSPAAEIGNFWSNASGNRFVLQGPNGAGVNPLTYTGVLPAITPGVGIGPVMQRVHTINWDYTEPTGKIYINGSQQGNSGSYTKMTYGPTAMRVGSDAGGSGTNNIKGDIAKIFFLKGTYSDAIKTELRTYFNNQYSTTLYKKSDFNSNGKSSITFDTETIIETGSGTFDYISFADIAIDSGNIINLVYRNGSDHNLTLDGSIIHRTDNADAGLTWNSGTVIVPARGGILITNPSITITSTGRMIVFFTKEVSPARESWLVYKDPGQPWSAEIRVTTDYPSPGMIDGPGKAIEISGTLYKPYYARLTGSGNRDGVIYKSVDDGLTWTLHATMYPATSADYEEPTIFNNGDNLIIGLLRSDPLGSTRWIYSTDEDVFATVNSWSAPTGTTIMPEAATSNGKNPAAISPSKTILCMGRNTADGRAIIYYSFNKSRTWAKVYADARTGKYMYGGVVWHPVISKFITVHSVEVSTPLTGPCALVCMRWNEL
jgi:hypothetical protein